MLLDLASLRKRLARFVDLQSQQASPSVHAGTSAGAHASPARARTPGTPEAAAPLQELSPVPTPAGGGSARRAGGLFLSESRPEEDTAAALLALIGTSAAGGDGAAPLWARASAAAGSPERPATARRAQPRKVPLYLQQRPDTAPGGQPPAVDRAVIAQRQRELDEVRGRLYHRAARPWRLRSFMKARAVHASDAAQMRAVGE